MSKQNKKQPHLPPITREGRAPGAERRAVAARLMKEQRRGARRRSIAIQAGIGFLAVIAVVAVTLGVLSHRGDDGGAVATPSGLTADGAVRFGAEDAPVTLQAVEDFQCPLCQQFEAANGDLLTSYRKGGQVAVEYRPIAFLDSKSTTDYSTRALNASMCVLDDAGKDAWLVMHQALYSQQPEEGSAGLTDAQLTTMAEDAGASSAVASCIGDRTYGDWAARQTDAAFDDGVTGTPTVFVDGTKLGAVDQATIEKAVAAAGAK